MHQHLQMDHRLHLLQPDPLPEPDINKACKRCYILEPKIINPFSEEVFLDLKEHVDQIRRCFDWPGVPLHDKDATVEHKMNRWFWHNLPLLKHLHHSKEMRDLADETFGLALKPSYVFLSMYSPTGLVPLHSDRPQCFRTIDLQISSDGVWPIYIEEKPYILEAGQALCYSGTSQPHYRKPMTEDSKNFNLDGPTTFMNLAFFHFVPVSWMGALD
jgi:hypothetical protein